ncbi:hypothetical protein Lesp02_02630 [Lentzea sp. NBRC 105346]|uniref:TIGR02679 domain-containing protein n=1 Tax=Lentzea sp. NBRC 105346 TaxID=3032205 RepID=UPI0024A3F1D1|nr:TIGR02679 domain-containing protein [Lentzea sp. NBRC 105346]GLZ28073.1 hypothetical protein Lesp02_02630 [Lentzea sp. NBRC 105346]
MPADTTPADPQDQFAQWAAKDGPAKIITALCAHLEAGHSWGHTELPADLTPQQRRQVRDLLGTKWDASGRGVTPHMLKTRLIKQGLDADTALRQLIGRDLTNRRTQLREHRARAAAERQDALDTLIEAGVPRTEAETWLGRRGLPPAGHGQLLAHVQKIATVWRHLPHGGDTIMLSVLADAACDDPHALDRRAGRLGLDILRLANSNAPDADDNAYDIEGWRTAWDTLGVVCDPLSSRVLVLNLPLTGTAAACAITAAGCQTGEPVWLTWRSLNGDFALDHNQCGQDRRVDVYVCENPTVVAAAADALGARTHPLVCTNGVPSGAVRKLLAGLATTGARLIIRADDDPAGQAIVQQLLSLVPHAMLWRYTRRAPDTATPARQYEERVLATLLTDLSRD